MIIKRAFKEMFKEGYFIQISARIITPTEKNKTSSLKHYLLYFFLLFFSHYINGYLCEMYRSDDKKIYKFNY